MEKINELNKDLLIKQFNEFKVESFNDLEELINYLKIKIDNIKEPFLDKNIYDLGLSQRTFNCIMYFFGYYNYYDKKTEKPKAKHILNISLKDFKNLRNVGQKTIDEIQSLLNQNGYSFKP